MPGAKTNFWELCKANSWQILRTVGTLVVFGLGLHQYSEAQRWHRIEFLDAQIRALDDDKEASRAKVILDFTDALVCLENPESTKQPICGAIADTTLTRIFRQAVDTIALDLKTQAVISDFDALFRGLDRIGFLEESGILEGESRHPSVAYWVDVLGRRAENHQDVDLQVALCRYLDMYGYEGVQYLIAAYVPQNDRVCINNLN